MSQRCMGCMESFNDMYDICPYCGFEVGTPAEDAIHLNPGTILHNRYLIGRVLGYGGFGVTYIGWDGSLEQKVAIKEYLPGEFSTRMPGQTCVTIFNGDKSEQFAAGLDEFVDEGNRLARFMNEQGIVRIFDSFHENDTAYIVMEYLEGETLEQRLEREGIIPEDEAVEMLMPVMLSLKEVHNEGIIHRDISPDNIFIKNDGTVKLIDFGASRYATTTHSRSLTVIIKPGYSPVEQYRSNGDQGPHTDVYSLAATMYRMITGERPPDAMNRFKKMENSKTDLLIEPARINKNISANRQNAILNALNIRIEDRTPDIETFISEINADPPAKRRTGRIKKIDLLSWPLWLKILIPTLFTVLLTTGILLATGVIHFDQIFPTLNVPEGYTKMPDVCGKELDIAIEELSECKYENIIGNKGIKYEIIENVESEYTEVGTIAYQDIPPGTFITRSDSVGLRVNRGVGVIEAENGIATVPFVLYSEQEDAINLLMEASLTYAVEEEYDDNVKVGLVCKQSIDHDEKVAEGTEVTITISKGPELFDVPYVVGMDYEEAEILLYNKGLKPERNDRETSQYPENRVIDQSPVDIKVKKGKSVVLIVAVKNPLVTIADVTGMTETQAKSTLDKQGFEVKINYEYNDSVEYGRIIEQYPQPGTDVQPGTRVTIVVSKGKYNYSVSASSSETVSNTETVSNISVPNVVGSSESSAKSALESKGFKVNTSGEYSDTVASGNVIRQSLSAGSSASKGDPITIVISKGKQPITVNFNPNGGSVSQSSKTVYHGDAYGTLPTPQRNNYTFNGWYTSSSGGSKITSSTTVNITSEQTLYAQWTEIKYTLYYDANGGSGAPSSQTGNGTVTVSSVKPTRKGYVFGGWTAIKNSTSGDIYQGGSKYSLTSDSTLYAYWLNITLSSTSGRADYRAVTNGHANIWSYSNGVLGWNTSLPTPYNSTLLSNRAYWELLSGDGVIEGNVLYMRQPGTYRAVYHIGNDSSEVYTFTLTYGKEVSTTEANIIRSSPGGADTGKRVPAGAGYIPISEVRYTGTLDGSGHAWGKITYNGVTGWITICTW